MGSPRYACGFHGCGFVCDSLDALAAHDAATGHPNPSGDELVTALARVQMLCASVGGHEPCAGNPGECGVCGATVPAAVGGRFVCRAGGCDFSTTDAVELDIHDVATHGLREVRPVAAAKLQRLMARCICEPRGGHVPSPVNPAACLVCGASLEVFRG